MLCTITLLCAYSELLVCEVYSNVIVTAELYVYVHTLRCSRVLCVLECSCHTAL
jgi:hypothetical protein